MAHARDPLSRQPRRRPPASVIILVILIACCLASLICSLVFLRG